MVIQMMEADEWDMGADGWQEEVWGNQGFVLAHTGNSGIVVSWGISLCTESSMSRNTVTMSIVSWSCIQCNQGFLSHPLSPLLTRLTYHASRAVTSHLRRFPLSACQCKS